VGWQPAWPSVGASCGGIVVATNFAVPCAAAPAGARAAGWGSASDPFGGLFGGLRKTDRRTTTGFAGASVGSTGGGVRARGARFVGWAFCASAGSFLLAIGSAEVLASSRTSLQQPQATQTACNA
jgi:hypothetical protein